jgi:hypothetical protein
VNRSDDGSECGPDLGTVHDIVRLFVHVFGRLQLHLSRGFFPQTILSLRTDLVFATTVRQGCNPNPSICLGISGLRKARVRAAFNQEIPLLSTVLSIRQMPMIPR